MQKKVLQTIMFKTISDFLMNEQIFRPPQVKQDVIRHNKLVYTSSLTSCQAIVGNEEISGKSQNLIEAIA